MSVTIISGTVLAFATIRLAIASVRRNPTWLQRVFACLVSCAAMTSTYELLTDRGTLPLILPAAIFFVSVLGFAIGAFWQAIENMTSNHI